MTPLIILFLFIIAKAFCGVAIIASLVICGVVVYAPFKNGILGVLGGLFFLPGFLSIFVIAIFAMLEFVKS